MREKIVLWISALFQELLASLSDFGSALKIFCEPVKRDYSVFEEFRIIRKGKRILASHHNFQSSAVIKNEPTLVRENNQIICNDDKLGQQILPNTDETSDQLKKISFIYKIINYDIAKIWTINLSPWLTLSFLIHWLTNGLSEKFQLSDNGFFKLPDPPYYIVPIIALVILYLFIKSLIFLTNTGYVQFKTNTAFFGALIISVAIAMIVCHLIISILDVAIGLTIGLAFILIIPTAAGIWSGLKIDELFTQKTEITNQ